jgi:hypothetical protein
MKAVIKSVARSLGYEVRRYTPRRDQAEIAKYSFRNDHYVRGDLRRLEHLASLGIVEKTEGIRLQVDYGNDQTALVERWRVRPK